MSDGLDSSFQSILLPVPEVDGLVDDFRLEGDWSRRLGVPAHLTLAGPWPLSQPLPSKRLSGLAIAARGTRYRLDVVDMLGDAVCLLPSDDRPLWRWRSRLLSVVGAPDAVSSAWRLHLTICRDDSGDRIKAARAAVDHVLPLECEIRELLIVRLVEPGRAVMESL